MHENAQRRRRQKPQHERFALYKSLGNNKLQATTSFCKRLLAEGEVTPSKAYRYQQLEHGERALHAQRSSRRKR